MTRQLSRLALAAEIMASYIRIRWMLRRHSLPTVMESLRQSDNTGGDEDVTLAEARRLGWAVKRTLSSLPADSRCLVRSLVQVTLLVRRGARPVLVIGVRPGVDFAAHAWVELAGEPVLAPRELEYHRLVEL